MITDPVPRGKELRRQYEESDAQPLQERAAALKAALASASRTEVRKAGLELLGFLAASYAVAKAASKATPARLTRGASPVANASPSAAVSRCTSSAGGNGRLGCASLSSYCRRSSFRRGTGSVITPWRALA